MDLHTIQQKMQRAKLRHRPSQLEMIEKVSKNFQERRFLCIEAPTGTGKTLSYLLGAALQREEGQKIVISTATLALQDQLIDKDLPLLEQLLEGKISYAVAKGRANYLCHQRLAQLREEPDLFAERDYLDDLEKLLDSPFWQGERDSLPLSLSDAQWAPLTTTSAGCSTKKCPFYDQCFYFKARNKMFAASLVVTNHSLLLADIELGGGVLLPDPKNTRYIIDECHHLPSRALTHFAKGTPLLRATDWINGLNQAIARAVTGKQLASSWHSKITQLTLLLVNKIKELKALLDANTLHFQEGIWRVLPEHLPSFAVCEELLTLSHELRQCFTSILTSMETDAEMIADKKSEAYEQHLRQLTQLRFLYSLGENFWSTWELFCQKPAAKEPPIARWFEANEDDYRCFCSPINVSLKLKALFWDKITQGALCCSATLRSLGSFDNFLRKSGLKLLEQVSTAVMPAIFNYTNSVIFVPAMQHEPSGLAQQAHRQEALTLLEDLILPLSGTLVLFTSQAAMQETFAQLRVDLAAKVLMQGSQPRAKLLETHKKRIDAGEGSTLFGLASFAEGIDLPARYCQHVIIHKLPFTVPSDPIEKTRSEWITQHQLNPFELATLPETSTRLTQYVGRLIRQEEDIGIVSILDRRLYTKPYGKRLLDNLPPFTRLIKAPISSLKQQPGLSELFETTN